MGGRRTALIVATDSYGDETFHRLRAPVQDAMALAAVLRGAAQHGYDVDVLHNAPATQVNRAIEHALVSAGRDDVFLFYFSGHGIKDSGGNLYFATVDSERRLPGSTMVAAQFVRSQLDHSRCGRKIVLLDCCFGGAFPRGHVARGQGAPVLKELTGQGCAVLTASTALEYAYEPDDPSPGRPGGQGRSLFTDAVVEGMRTGDADLDGDGWIDTDELYRYVADALRAREPRQNPSYDCKFSGRLVVTVNPRGPRLGFGLPDEITLALNSPLPRVRAAVAHYLFELTGNRTGMLAEHARVALASLAGDVDPLVRAAAGTVSPSPKNGFLPAPGRSIDADVETAELAARRAEQLEHMNDILVTFSRRTEALVERQLALVDQMELAEQDPDELAKLFELDHLATRMRRATQSALLLTKGTAWIRAARAMRLGDVLGAAVSELELYARVRISPVPDVKILGRHVPELIHLLAELLDNATTFSPDDTMVDLVARRTLTGGVGVFITDRGLGMLSEMLATANARLSSPPAINERAWQGIGLFLVGEVASRHNLRVELRPNDDGVGLTAVVSLPAELLEPDTRHGS